jgi:tetratricopeptide (TPR) repeat protein
VAALYCLGQCKLFTGSIEETIPLTERAIHLSPRDPVLGDWYEQIGEAHLLQSRTEDAIVWLEKARNYIPARSSIHRDLAAAYALRGEIERAAAELTEARRLSFDDRYSSIDRLFRHSWMSKIRALIDATYIAGLRKAGMPEE